jgi:hypothetical protein
MMDEGGKTRDEEKITNVQHPMSNVEVIMIGHKKAQKFLPQR